jgi:hypothetical protein
MDARILAIAEAATIEAYAERLVARIYGVRLPSLICGLDARAKDLRAGLTRNFPNDAEQTEVI